MMYPIDLFVFGIYVAVIWSVAALLNHFSVYRMLPLLTENEKKNLQEVFEREEKQLKPFRMAAVVSAMISAVILIKIVMVVQAMPPQELDGLLTAYSLSYVWWAAALVLFSIWGVLNLIEPWLLSPAYRVSLDEMGFQAVADRLKRGAAIHLIQSCVFASAIVVLIFGSEGQAIGWKEGRFVHWEYFMLPFWEDMLRYYSITDLGFWIFYGLLMWLGYALFHAALSLWRICLYVHRQHWASR